MVERRMCDVCGVRPAVTAVRRIVPGEPPRTEYLCEVHAAQARGGGRRSPFGGGRGLFDDFFNRFFDEAPEGARRTPIGEGGAAPRGRQAEQVDITQFFSDSTSELLQRAAQQAAEWGSLEGTDRRGGEQGRADRRFPLASSGRQAGAAFGLRGVAGFKLLVHRSRT